MRLALGGGWVQMKSADREAGLRSEGLGFVVLDEAAHMKSLRDRWEQELRPALADKQGSAKLASTPNGLDDFHDLYRKAETEPGLWAAMQYPSWTNPYLAKEEIEQMRKDMPALVFRQECGAEFVQFAGALCKREYFDAIDKCPALTARVRHWDLAASVKTKADRSAGVLMGETTKGDYIILDCVAGKWEWPDLIRIIRDTARADGPEVAQVVESVGTQKGFVQLLQAEPGLKDIAIRPGDDAWQRLDKLTRFNPFLARAEQGNVKLLRGAWNNDWLNEVCNFTGDSDKHDDIVDATSGAYHYLAKPDPWIGLKEVVEEW
jgi:predicted phage terminase large subunit-like protein